MNDERIHESNKSKVMPKIKTVHGIENRKVVSQKEWLAARKKLLKEEKTFTKLRDKLNLQRRKLPWVKIEKEYVFDGPGGKVTLGDLFSVRTSSSSITSCSGRAAAMAVRIARSERIISTA